MKLVESADAEVFGDTTNKSLLAALRRIARRDLDGTPVATRAGA